jgi:hypothetical protein
MNLSCLAALVLSAAPLAAADFFPFVIPWDDAAPGLTDWSALNDRPAGKDGPVIVKDGQLFSGGKRLRIFGVNLCFGANFPAKEVAPKLAARLAKLGVNCVRFHHMDMFSAPAGIFAPDGRAFAAERLDRLDFFIAQLKAQGIYTNLNLHVSRTHPDRPKAEKAGNPNFDKGVDNFSAAMIAAQKDFARALLGHVNPYLGTSYAQEPAVAFVEINNENALLFEWQTGGLDGIAAPYREELSTQWTQWLTAKHGQNLATAWSEGAREAGPELLHNGSFAEGGTGWLVEQHEGTSVQASYEDGCARLAVSGAAKEAWHAQFTRSGLKLASKESYAVRFRAKASGREKIRVALAQAHAPWKVLASRTVELAPEWREVRIDLAVGEGDENARLVLGDLARRSTTIFWFDDVSLRTTDVDGAVVRDAAGRIPAFTKNDYARRTKAAQEDWLRFLWSREEAYWPGMYRFLREELGVRGLIIGTQLGWSPFPIQQQMDVIDSHAYWQHPHFPGRDWDLGNWTVQNTPMAGAPDGGTLARLALQRVVGKPYVCTEYNHAAPNQYDAETFPLVLAYAALQDWDGVFAFAYSHRGDDWERGFFSSFFDIDRHPVKLATLPGAVALFRRGDVAAAKADATVRVSEEQVLAQLRRSGPWISAEHFGVPKMAALVRRVGIGLGASSAPPAQRESGGPAYRSETGELTWDTGRGVVLIDTPRSKAAIGRAGEYTLGEVRVHIASPWACVQATVSEGESWAVVRRALITVAGAAQNTGMQWTSEAKDSVGKNWGQAPSLVEGVRVKVALPGQPKRAWALDERGQRGREVPLAGEVLASGPEHGTLWYEVEW